MDAVTRELIAQGVLGALIVGAMLGLIEFLPAIRERKEREKIKDAIIERQAIALEKIADKLDMKI